MRPTCTVLSLPSTTTLDINVAIPEGLADYRQRESRASLRGPTLRTRDTDLAIGVLDQLGPDLQAQVVPILGDKGQCRQSLAVHIIWKAATSISSAHKCRQSCKGRSDDDAMTTVCRK
jgi:hypothetical protein